MIETVLLDLGNVLVPYDFSKGARAFAALLDIDERELFTLMTGPRLLDICAGAEHPFDFFDELARKVGRSIDRERARHAWCDIFTPDAEMIALAGGLAARYPTYLWSNIDPLHREHLWPQLPCLTKFRGLHLSYELRAAKPNREFYLRALAKGGIEPRNAVFVDDVPANIAAAAELGITVLLHRSVAETREKLAALGVTP